MANKGIKDLLARKLAENSKRHAEAEQQPFFEDGRQHVKLALDQIDPNPYQPRRDFPKAELEALAASIAEAGLLQPVSVRAVGGRYQLIAGERRWRAHRLLGRPSIEALVVPAEDGDLAVLALAENLAREDLSDYEVGKALRQVETLFPTKKKLAEALGLNREDMYRYFAFESLPEAVRARLEQRPKLLARAAAADLKRLLQREARAGAVLEEAWPPRCCDGGGGGGGGFSGLVRDVGRKAFGFVISLGGFNRRIRRRACRRRECRSGQADQPGEPNGYPPSRGQFSVFCGLDTDL